MVTTIFFSTSRLQDMGSVTFLAMPPFFWHSPLSRAAPARLLDSSPRGPACLFSCAERIVAVVGVPWNGYLSEKTVSEDKGY